MHRALLAAGNVKYMSIGAPPSESQHSAASCNGETEHKVIFLFTVVRCGSMGANGRNHALATSRAGKRAMIVERL